MFIAIDFEKYDAHLQLFYSLCIIFFTISEIFKDLLHVISVLKCYYVILWWDCHCHTLIYKKVGYYDYSHFCRLPRISKLHI